MDPATMTRGFMGLLSESQDHLNDTEVRVRGVRVSPSRVGEPDPLVEADGGLVAFGDLQFELLQRAGAGPVDDRTEERLACAPPASPTCRPRGRSPDAPGREARRPARTSARLPRRAAWSDRPGWSPTP